MSLFTAQWQRRAGSRYAYTSRLALSTIAIALALSTPLWAATITTSQSGPWSDPNTWSSGVPTKDDEVTIQTNHTVTIDIMTATASTTTVDGTLTFSRAVSSSFTLVGGDLIVNPGGTLDLGTEASPIPPSVRAYLVLAYGSSAGEFGMTVQNGGNFTVRGATKTPYGLPESDVLKGASSLSISASSSTGWTIGDGITIAQTGNPLWSLFAESRIITDISGTDPKTISWDTNDVLFADHYATGPAIIANISRNVLIRSSGTTLSGAGGNSAYIRSLVENSTSFYMAHGEFTNLGTDEVSKYGVTLDGPVVKADISSCSFHSNYVGIYSNGASSHTFAWNVLSWNSYAGIRLDNSSTNNTLTANSANANGVGFEIAGLSSSNTINGNFAYTNTSGIRLNMASSNTITANKLYSNPAAINLRYSTNNDIVSNIVYATNQWAIKLIDTSDNNNISSNTVFSNQGDGIFLSDSSRNILTSNITHGNAGTGISMFSGANYNMLISNVSSTNTSTGIYIGSSYNTLLSNEAYNNGPGKSWGIGLDINGSYNILVDNESHSNGVDGGGGFHGAGVLLRQDHNTILSNHIYSNPAGIEIADSSDGDNLLVDGMLGYDAEGSAAANSLAEIYFKTGVDGSLSMKQMRINPANGIFTDGLDEAGDYLISYNQDYATGTVKLWGDYTNYTSLTLDYSAQLYSSDRTTPKIMRGASISAIAVNSTYDANAVTQLITVTYQSSDSQWHVAGSSSGELGTLPTGGGTADFPSASPQFRLTLTAASPLDGDRTNFALIAASDDANRQKKLLIGPPAPSFNSGRSKLTIWSGASLVLRGIDGAPTLMDRLDPSDPFYSIVSSGAFTAAYSSMTNMDSSGIQLSGSAGVNISSSTIDYLGLDSGVNAYITARDLTANTTFFTTTFATSRSTQGASAAYNVLVEGDDTNLELYFRGKSGPLWGEAHDNDPNDRITWWEGPPPNPTITDVYTTSITATWGQLLPDRYMLEASTAADFTGTVLASSTYDMYLTTLTVQNLHPNTTYYLRASALWAGSTEYADTTPVSTSTLPNAVTDTQVYDVHFTSVTLNWKALPTAAQEGSSSTAEGYLLETSTAADFTGEILSSSTINVELSTLSITNLTGDVTYYFRVGALNWNSEINYLTAGSTVMPPVCASLVSTQDGFWSLDSTWSRGSAPTSCNSVLIAPGRTVTVDIATATARTTTIQGTLTFSRVKQSSLTIVDGDVVVEAGGTLDMGTEASPIPPGATAHLLLAYGSSAAEYGLTVEDGGNFTVQGATKSPYAFAATDSNAGAGTLDVTAAESVGWNIGDRITVGPTAGSGLATTEDFYITGISIGDPRTISLSGTLAAARTRSSTTPIVVSNLTRNVLVRSSGTDTGVGGNSAYITNLVTNATSFNLAYGEFAYLGGAGGNAGIRFLGAKGSISSSTIREGYYGISASGGGLYLLEYNNIYKSSQWGLYSTGVSFSTITFNNFFENQDNGIYVYNNTGEGNILERNLAYSNGAAGVYIERGATQIVSANYLFSNGGSGLDLVQVTGGSVTWNNAYANAGAGIHVSSTTSIPSNNVDIIANNTFSNDSYGIFIENSASTTLRSNNVYSNAFPGINIYNSNNNVLESNAAYANAAAGIQLYYSGNNTLLTNRSYFNTGSSGYGASLLTANDTILVANEFYSNSGAGIRVSASNSVQTFIGNKTYSNLGAAGYGLQLVNSTGVRIVEGSIGYDSSGTAAANAGGEVNLDPDVNAEGLELIAVRIDPANITTAGLNTTGGHIIAYNQNYSTGTIRLWGDYTLSGSTLTLDYSSRLYASYATMPRIMRGVSITGFSINSTDDGNAISQLITASYRSSDSQWHVIGSSSGELGTLPAGGGTADFPSSVAQFNLTMAASSPKDGDRADFALSAASDDADRQKKLLMGPSAAGFNNGRSKLSVAADGGLVLRGIDGDPTLMDRMDASSTYYSFVSSGAFTALYSSITNVGPKGIELSGSAGVSIASTTFDFMGIAEGANTYITARDLVSQTTFYNVNFETSRSTNGAPSAYNVSVVGDYSGLLWQFLVSIGALSGENHDDDANERVSWSNSPLLPGTPGSPAGTVLGVSSVAWTWSAATAASSYDIFPASDTSSLIATTGTVNYIHTGQSTNTAVTIVTRGDNFIGVGPFSPSGTVYTAAAPPTNLSVTNVKITSATLNWSLNTNPTFTQAEVERSPDNLIFTKIAQGAVSSFTDPSLAACTTFYFRVRNLNGNNIPTTYSDSITFQTKNSTPMAPTGLTAESIAGRRIHLSWNPSPSTTIEEYRLFYDNGTGAVDYATPLATLSTATALYTTAPLVQGTSYTFVLRAVNHCGVEEDNTNVSASAYAAGTLPSVRASIRTPASGMKIAGNRVTILAEISIGTQRDVKEVRFQYKASTDTAWQELLAATPYHPNPDYSAPFYMHWNLTGWTATDYDLRAVAADFSGTADDAAPGITVTVDPTDYDLREYAIGGGRIQKDQTIYNSVGDTMHASDPMIDLIAKLAVPADALSDPTVTLTIVSNPADTPAATGFLRPTGIAAEITLSNSQTLLLNGHTASLTFAYADQDGDGFVDGTLIPTDELAIYAYDVPTTRWRKESITAVDQSSNTLTCGTPHFSFFAAFVPAHADLSAIRVYPSPYKPNNGNADDGTAYAPGDLNSGIIFDNLPADVTIRIYSVSAQLVREINSANTSGRVQWDVKNELGQDVASGGYFAVINSPGQITVFRKIGVIR